MRVVTRWPALVPAIERAGHTAVLDYTDPPGHPSGAPDNVPSMAEAAGAFEHNLPTPPLTARPRGVQRRPR